MLSLTTLLLFSTENIPVLIALSILYSSTAILAATLLVVWCRLNDGIKVRPLVIVLFSGVLLSTFYGVLVLLNATGYQPPSETNNIVLLRYAVYSIVTIGRSYSAVRMFGFGDSFYAWAIPVALLCAHLFGLAGMYCVASSSSLELVGFYVFGTGVVLLAPPLLCFLNFARSTILHGPKIGFTLCVFYVLFYWSLWPIAVHRWLSETTLAFVFSLADSFIHLAFVIVYGRLLVRMLETRSLELEDERPIWPLHVEKPISSSQRSLLFQPIRDQTGSPRVFGSPRPTPKSGLPRIALAIKGSSADPM